jgi:hypothetical protein
MNSFKPGDSSSPLRCAQVLISRAIFLGHVARRALRGVKTDDAGRVVVLSVKESANNRLPVGVVFIGFSVRAAELPVVVKHHVHIGIKPLRG